MSSLTTLFVVGPEEYVEFNESLGSKAFLEHVWDESTTPLKEGETSDSRLRSAGARVSSNPSPHIEFPTILRIKGKGNKYKPTGRWISWDELHRQNPLAVSIPPDLEQFKQQGGQVGSGKKLKAGEWLAESKKAAKLPPKSAVIDGDDGWIGSGAAESVYAPKTTSSANGGPTQDVLKAAGVANESQEKLGDGESQIGLGLQGSNDTGSSLQNGRIGKGASESIYAPKPAPKRDELVEENGWIGVNSATQATPPRRQTRPIRQAQNLPSTSTATSSSTTTQDITSAAERPGSLASKFQQGQASEGLRTTRSGRSLFAKFVSDAPSPETPLAPLPPPSAQPSGPVTPARRRNVNLHIDPSLPLSANRSFDSSLVSPSTARTPLSATHPLPETPLKHTQELSYTPSNSAARVGLAERRRQAPVTPISSSSYDHDAAARGLGLGLTPTRPNTFGGPLSPIQQRRALPPSRRLSRPLEETLKEVEIEQTEEASKGLGFDHDLSLSSPVRSKDKPENNSNQVEKAQQQAGNAANEIEAMLMRLRKARTGFAGQGGDTDRGSSASRWATPADGESISNDDAGAKETPVPMAAVVPPTPALGSGSEAFAPTPALESSDTFAPTPALGSSSNGFTATPAMGSTGTFTTTPALGSIDSFSTPDANQADPPQSSTRTLLSRLSEPTVKSAPAADDKAIAPSVESSKPAKLTSKERRERAKERKQLAAQQQREQVSAAATKQSNDHRVPSKGSTVKEEDKSLKPANLFPPPPTEPRAMRRGSSSKNSDGGRSASSSSALTASDKPRRSSATSNGSSSKRAVTPTPATINSTPTDDIAETTAVADDSIVVHPSHSPTNSISASSSSGAHFDWAADDEDDDELPDLDDWGITLPSSSSINSMASQPPPQEKQVRQERVPYWEKKQKATPASSNQRRELFPNSNDSQQKGEKTDTAKSRNSNRSRELFGDNDTRIKGKDNSSSSSKGSDPVETKAKRPTRELFPSSDTNTSADSKPHGSTNGKKVDAEAVISSGPKGLRIAGSAEQSASKSEGRRELMPGTVHSMHAPAASEDQMSSHARGKGAAAGNGGAFARITKGIVGVGGQTSGSTDKKNERGSTRANGGGHRKASGGKSKKKS
ncbi:unnamed protein product [Sympodiomycopsis kandeliae]